MNLRLLNFKAIDSRDKEKPISIEYNDPRILKASFLELDTLEINAYDREMGIDELKNLKKKLVYKKSPEDLKKIYADIDRRITELDQRNHNIEI